uniref:Augerpeptide hheTx2 n=1 Tax=Hastula hectica TaxID=745793 RepID=TE2_HASHE|nr:RecName: Full=Augerpeptide hheTx2 [Hastula hectica]
SCSSGCSDCNSDSCQCTLNQFTNSDSCCC